MNSLWLFDFLKDPHHLFGVLSCLFVTGIYMWSVKRGRKIDLLTTLAVALAIAAILLVSTNWNLLIGVVGSSAPVQSPHAVTVRVQPTVQPSVYVYYPTAKQSVLHSVPHHTATPSSFPVATVLEGIASVIGGIVAGCILLVVLSLTLTKRRQPSFIEQASTQECLECGQEGEFPVYRDAKGQRARLCTDCVGRFHVTPVR